MKKVFYVIIFLFILLLGIFGITNITKNEKASKKTEKILVAKTDEVSTATKEELAVPTDEKIPEIIKTEEKKIETSNKVIETKVKKNTTVSKKTTSSKKQVTTNSNNNSNKNNNIKYGTYGRLYINNYSVALYDFNVNTSSKKDLQTIVDDKDSAAYYINWDKLIIADHSHQGFNILVNLNIGTTSYIKFKNGKTIKYKLIYKSKGTNAGEDLIDTNGNSFFDMDSDIIMYTCYKNGIMVTLWNLA